jgi:hypothetical protein
MVSVEKVIGFVFSSLLVLLIAETNIFSPILVGTCEFNSLHLGIRFCYPILLNHQTQSSRQPFPPIRGLFHLARGYSLYCSQLRHHLLCQ